MALECMAIREEFSALLDGELSPEERARVDVHLSECAECLRALNGYQQVDQMFSALPDVAAPDNFERNIHRTIQPSNVVAYSGKKVVAVIAAAAASFVMVMGLFVFPQLKHTQVAKRDLAVESAAAPAASETMSDQDVTEQEAAASMLPESDGAIDSGFADDSTALFDSRESGSRARRGEDKTRSQKMLATGSIAVEESVLGETVDLGDTLDTDDLPREHKPENLAAAGTVAQPSQFRAKNWTADEVTAGAEIPGRSHIRGPMAAESEESAEVTAKSKARPEPVSAVDPGFKKESNFEATDEPAEVARLVAPDSERKDVPASKPTDLLRAAPTAPSLDLKGTAATEARRSNLQSTAAATRENEKVDAPRIFTQRDGALVEAGYTGQTVAPIDRASTLYTTLITTDSQLKWLAETGQRAIFLHDGTWHSFEALPR